MSEPPPLGRPVRSSQRVAGGSINDAWRVELESGEVVFVKSRSDATSADFTAEAAGLRWLAEAGAPVPGVIEVGQGEPWIALEWVEPGRLGAAGAERLGQDLAGLHRSGAPAHGSLPPGSPDTVLRIGSAAVEISECDEWPGLYAQRLLAPLATRAAGLGRLTARDARAVESVCERMAELAGPPEPPARLHGDLWGGNLLAAADGSGVLIDPAAYGGHREVDLAMLRLFGAPDTRIFDAYAEAHPLADGHAERVGLWQLLPLLVHALLFGGSYGRSAGDVARRYA